MNSWLFLQTLEDQLEITKAVLGSKAVEYATDDDRLYNFRQAAHLQGITPVQALGGMMAKHTVSVYDLIATGDFSRSEIWYEKITDHINYLILLRAFVDEYQDQLEPEEAPRNIITPPEARRNECLKRP